MPKRLNFTTVDVFTAEQFNGNPLAVVRDAEGLSTAQMQAIAAEFNLSETTFVLPPRIRRHRGGPDLHPARRNAVRRPPEFGTAFVLGRLGETMAGPSPAIA